ncbi:uncharacterized protein K02A2.6-like [Pectinophora gossypiella]|uniref:uncharacterized protein K02A2.6-like n=1 Tax=Pectinophora gossypiella TaxID=13191 RepID=UPI00214ECAAD|nr:uncharacterized protein K02A2.6-like [Pectinophora gossypiella]
MRARPLAYALREPVERALDSLVNDGVITPVNTSDWATPIVPVMKKDGTIRVCGDFKITLNKVLEVDRFPLPRVEDLLTKLHGGDKFTKIDLSQAYSQFELDEKSKQYTVINTHRGLFKYNRLIFGLASSPGIFQRKLEQLFADMPRVGVFLDDLIITGRNDQEHIETLHEVFNRLAQYGLKIRKDKCSFFTDSVTYLGFVIDRDGVHTTPEKIEAILKVPVPQNVSELRSFLGLVMYYAKFVSNISTVLSPLYKLLRKESKYVWDEDCDRAFNKVKEMLVSSEVLAHYSPELPLVLTTDASSVGVGAVISHVTPQRERPISVMWWPGIDADIEAACRECAVCVAESPAPPRAPPQPWPHVTEPWSRLHLDFLESVSESESAKTLDGDIENPSDSRVQAPSTSDGGQSSNPTVPLADARRPGLRPRDMLRSVTRYGFEID